jgi:hypothetical protein
LPEIPSGTGTGRIKPIAVEELGIEGLVEEYHRLKHSQVPKDRERLIQVELRLDQMNQQEDSQT